MSTFHLPDLGEGLSEAEIREWHVREGDVINIDDPLVSVETAKAVVEVPSPIKGTVTKCYGKPGEVVATGAALVDFDEGESAATTTREDSGTVVGRVTSGETVIHESAAGITPRTRTQVTSTIKASPAIRLLAHQMGIALAEIQGTGPNGTITRKDIETAAQSAPATLSTTEGVHTEKLSAVDRFMAELMEKSHREVVPVTVIDDADISHWQADQDITVTLIKAIAHASTIEPHLNAHFDSEHLTRNLFDDIDLGLALDTAEGLFVPVIRAVRYKSDQQLRTEINQFKQKAQARTLTPEEMQGATIVLSNFGSIGGKYANPIVVPPTVAIIGVGHRFQQNAHSQQSNINNTMLPISLTFDHRAITGGQASRFIAAMVDYLSN